MSDDVRSMVLGPSALYAVALAALVLTLARRPAATPQREMDRLVGTFLVGVAAQCVHFTEEYVTGFHLRMPPFLGLAPWSGEFFVAFNLAWIALWVLAAAGIRAGLRAAFFPAWFFAVAMVGNAVWHPLLALATGGYFPGLVTSPIGGVIGVLLLRRLRGATAPAREAAAAAADARGA